MTRYILSTISILAVTFAACSVEFVDGRGDLPEGQVKNSKKVQAAEVNSNSGSAPTTQDVVAAPTATPGSTATPTAGATTRGLLKLATTDLRAGKTVWEFTVPPLSAAAPDWNTAATFLDLRKGEILRIKTSEAGRGFHTSPATNAPCTHGGNRQYDATGAAKATLNPNGAIDVGGYFECDITVAVDSTADSGSPVVYDHLKGMAVQVFMKVAP